MNTRFLPHEAALIIHRVQDAGRYLDNLTANVSDQATADLVRAHANAVWDAALVLETLTRVLRDVIPSQPVTES